MKKAIGVFLMLVLVLGLCSCMPRVTESGFMQLGNWEWTAARDFSGGYAAVQIGSRWGYINTDGTLVLNAKWDKAGPFSDGCALVCSRGKYSYVKATGN